MSDALSVDQWISISAVVGTWLAAIGTIAAVLISLKLAWRSTRVKLTGSVYLLYTNCGKDSPIIAKMTIGVINVGYAMTVLHGFSWQIGKRKNKKYLICNCSTHPKKLMQGEVYQVGANIFKTLDVRADLTLDFLKNGPIKTLRLRIHTTSGHITTIVPDSRFLEQLRKLNSQIYENNGKTE